MLPIIVSMNSENLLQEYRSKINSILPESEQVNFEDDWHGPMSEIYEIYLNGGKVSQDQTSCRKFYLEYLENCGHITKSAGCIEMTKKGFEYFSVYMAALERKLKDLGYNLERKFEVDVLSGEGFKTRM
jgi:hypothetical protein